MDVFRTLVLSWTFVLISAQASPEGCPAVITSCPAGMRLDSKYVLGCFDTVCVPDGCPYFKCSACYYGYKVNKDGCVGCECKTAPSVTTSKSCPQQVTTCSKGMRLDSKYVQGCFDNVCVPANCPLIKCAACDYGYKVMDDGCVGCECKPKPVRTDLLNLLQQFVKK